MNITYPENIDHWEKWQQAYRFGLILIMPPEPVFSQVNALRSEFDPRSQSYCDAHISLSLPIPRPITEADWAELVDITSQVRPFEIHYGKLKDYPPYPGVVISIEPQSMVKQVQEKIEKASLFKDATPRKFPFNAHMTIAEFISVETTASLLKELEGKTPEGTFLCDSLVFIVPDDNMHFHVVRKLHLGGLS
ncbi:MAG: 2'-5' RNA ligase family protein [Bacteroidia bacterium]